MLKFINWPPQSAKDVEFTKSFAEDMKTLLSRRPETNARNIGSAVGSCILANLEQPNVGVALQIASELCGTNELLEPWEIQEQFMEGAVWGTINENSHSLPEDNPREL